MAGREFQSGLRRRAARSTAFVALVALVLLSGSALAWRRVAALRSQPAAEFSAVVAAGQEQPKDSVIGEFDGYFDAATRRIVIQPKTGGAGSARGRAVNGRNDPNSELTRGTQFGFSVIASKFIATGDNPGTVSGEVQISNLTGVPLYNTRVVFTSFKVGGANGADAGNLPSATGFAYFNDGLVAADGRLNVSRYYGDIPAGGSARNIWTFATTAQPPNFFFSYKVLADIGVAAESVQPAAVQVAATGTSVQINGRGFANPTVELLNGTTVVAPLAVTASSATSITATVPANTAAGIYSVRVTNAGSTAGGPGSSTLLRKLTVTGVPDSAHTINAGALPNLADTGPYLISGNVTVGGPTNIQAGTVLYIASGATITVQAPGNIQANGGIVGVTSTSQNQIVFTAQRSPGAALPTAGAWGGINLTSANDLISAATMRNVVVEFGGAANGAAINLNNSGRKLILTDSIVRGSAGAAVSAAGANDALQGFARNRIENNGSTASDIPVLLSANASLGLYDLPTGELVRTSVGDGSYYYSSANEFTGNQNNVVQIGTDTDLASNDFTKSGVLVGQGNTPLRIRGNCANPAIVGALAPAKAELTITATAKIELAPDLVLQAGSFPGGLVGCIAANGYAGVYQGPEAVTSNKYIEFNKIPSLGNFSAIYFTRNAMTNCVLNYTKIQGGGAASACSPGAGEVVAEVLGIRVTNSQISGSATGGLAQTVGGRIDSRGTTISGTTPIIETIAGGLFGDGTLATQAVLATPVAIAVDPLGRGIFVVDDADPARIRFINTSRNTVTIGTIKVAAGAIASIAGGGEDLSENAAGNVADIGKATGLAVNPTGDLLYYIDSLGSSIRAVNISPSVKTIAGASIDPGKVGTFATGGAAAFGSALNGLVVNQSTGDVYVADATPGQSKVFKVSANPASPSADATVVAGMNSPAGNPPRATDPFSAGPATSISLLGPRAITLDAAGNLYIADTGHARVIKVDASGNATLMVQFTQETPAPIDPYPNPPFPSGLTVLGNKLYIANGNAQDIAAVTLNAPGSATSIAGAIGTTCDYTASNPTCGDGDLVEAAIFGLLGSTASIPLAGIAADGKGIYVLDQGGSQRGRVRYLNVSAMAVEIAGVQVPAGVVTTVVGSGLPAPYDKGAATSASFNSPNGVAMDPNGNLWITEVNSGKLRFVNLGTTPVTLFPGVGVTNPQVNPPTEQTVAPGAIVTVNFNVGFGAGDGVPVSQASFDLPQGIFATDEGIYIADSRGKAEPVGTGNNRRKTGYIRFINTKSTPVTFYSGSVAITVDPGQIKVIAGGGTAGDIGDGAAPLAAKFLAPEDVVVRPNGDIYVADAGNNRVRKIVRATGVVSTIGLPTATTNQYTGLGLDSSGRLLVANAGANTILREKTPNSGDTGTTGFDTILTGGELKRPRDVASDAAGNLYVTNPGEILTPPVAGSADYRVLKITGGVAATFAGKAGQKGYSGDGGPATNALLNNLPEPINIGIGTNFVNIRATVNILVTPSGDVIFADPKNGAIRRVR